MSLVNYALVMGVGLAVLARRGRRMSVSKVGAFIGLVTVGIRIVVVT